MSRDAEFRVGSPSFGAHKRRCSGAVRLGEVLREVIDERIGPAQGRFARVAGVWEEILPAELKKHCRIAGLKAGNLSVEVDSPSYMHELRLASEELISELSRRCPAARISEIQLNICEPRGHSSD